MNNSPLVPTPTVDKNGRQTTVYRRSEKRHEGSSLPAPTMGPSDTAVSKTLIDRLSRILSSGDGPQAAAAIQEKLLPFSPDFRARLEAVLMDSDPEFSLTLACKLDNGDTEAYLNECIRFMGETGLGDFDRSSVIVRSLHHYPYLIVSQHEDLSKTSEEVQEGCSWLLRVTAALDELYDEDAMTSLNYIDDPDDPDEYVPVIADKDFAELVFNDAKAADKLLHIIDTHQIHDVNRIMGIFNGVEPSLAGGSL